MFEFYTKREATKFVARLKRKYHVKPKVVSQPTYWVEVEDKDLITLTKKGYFGRSRKTVVAP